MEMLLFCVCSGWAGCSVSYALFPLWLWFDATVDGRSSTSVKTKFLQRVKWCKLEARSQRVCVNVNFAESSQGSIKFSTESETVLENLATIEGLLDSKLDVDPSVHARVH